MNAVKMLPALVVHGGAGHFDEALHDAARAGCHAAVEAGLAAMAGGGSALDAVAAAVRVLEDDPVFNAGVGAVLTRAETVELDAAIMDGTRLRYGAIAAMRNARQPVDIARAVMDDGEHTLLCAEGAWEFARERGFVPCDPTELITERAYQRLREEAERRQQGKPAIKDPGTVGACAIDASGRVAAATSTGGTTYKRVGRIGDSPLCGCGTYADDRGGAASATGDGEAIMRVAMTRSCVTHMRSGDAAAGAAQRSVAELGDDVGGMGGIICCDHAGRLGAAHNSEHMAFGAGILRADAPATLAGVVIPPGMDLMAQLRQVG